MALAALREFASGRMARFKCPEALYITTDLPKTATGKVAKNMVRAEVTKAGEAIERAW